MKAVQVFGLKGFVGQHRMEVITVQRLDKRCKGSYHKLSARCGVTDQCRKRDNLPSWEHEFAPRHIDKDTV